MFANHHIIDRLVQDHQKEVQREIQGQRYDSGTAIAEARVRLVKLISLLVAAGWLISILL